MSQSALKEAAHDRAGDDHLGIGQSVANLASVALNIDETGRPQEREMLTRVGLADVQSIGDATDLQGTLAQQMKHLEAPRVGEHAEHIRL